MNHHFAMLVCYDLPEAEAVALHANPEPWEPNDHAIAYVQGPGCTVCKMVVEELMIDGKIRSCPGERPKELDTLRGVGDSMWAGLPRSERRKLQHKRRKQGRKVDQCL